jgi:hypothetical protein
LERRQAERTARAQAAAELEALIKPEIDRERAALAAFLE